MTVRARPLLLFFLIWPELVQGENSLAQKKNAGSDSSDNGARSGTNSIFATSDKLMEQAVRRQSSIERCVDARTELRSPEPLPRPELEWDSECRAGYPIELQNALQKNLQDINREDKARGRPHSKEGFRLMMEADRHTYAYNACVEAKRKRSLSRPELDAYMKMYSDCQINTSMETMATQKTEIYCVTTATFYYACLAVGADDAAVCKNQAANTEFNREYHQRSCRHRYDEAMVYKAIVTKSPDVEGRCAAICAQVPTWVVHPLINRPAFVTSEFCAKACELMRSDQYEAGNICAKTARFFSDPVEAEKSCEEDYFLPDFYSMDLALQGDCFKTHYTWQMEACREYSAFKKAFDARDFELCGDNPLCRKMMGGDSAVCQVYEERVKAPFCVNEAGRRVQQLDNERQLDFQSKRKQIYDSCDRIMEEASLGLDVWYRVMSQIPSGTPGWDVRLKKFRWLKKKYEHSAGKYYERQPL